MVAFLVGLTLLAAVAAHPCSDEMASACPDTPQEDLGDCLKDSSQHDKETEISSECTDFMALNKACREDVEKYCDENYFSDDVTPCLTQWTEPHQLSEKCQGVLKWAVPVADDDEKSEEGPTDELGMSDKDRAEKAEWQAKRKAGRGDAIERMKMKETDRKNEEDRVALQKYQEEDPEGYAQMIQQQAEEKRQQKEMKRRERQHAAALERQKRVQSGEDEDAETTSSKKGKKSKSGFDFKALMITLMKWIVLAAIVFGGYKLFRATSSPGAKRAAAGGKGSKKRR